VLEEDFLRWQEALRERARPAGPPNR
jgi:hypothetical protein